MHKLENTLDRMKTLIEIREILRGIYIPDEKDHFDEKEYYMELNQAYRNFRQAFQDLIADESARICKLAKEVKSHEEIS